jgi:molybdopterin synthase catalytic subunit
MKIYPPWIELTDQPIDLGSLRSKLEDPDVGAHGWFLGVTRRTTHDRVTATLSYEAHRPMAAKQLAEIGNQAMERFRLRHVVIVHRLGEVPVAQASVAVGCSSPHRVDTFAALPWIMDTLKQQVPIWKRETFVDGTTQWVHPQPEPRG